MEGSGGKWEGERAKRGGWGERGDKEHYNRQGGNECGGNQKNRRPTTLHPSLSNLEHTSLPNTNTTPHTHANAHAYTHTHTYVHTRYAHTASHCNTLQHTATHCNIHTITHTHDTHTPDSTELRATEVNALVPLPQRRMMRSSSSARTQRPRAQHLLRR